MPIAIATAAWVGSITGTPSASSRGRRWRAMPAQPMARAPVWLYSFDWETPVFGGRLKAFHALDVPFVFNTIDVVGSTDRGAVAHDLARRISATWATFARTGKPDNPAIPAWPTYTQAERATLILDRECRVANDYGRETRLLWKELTGV